MGGLQFYSVRASSFPARQNARCHVLMTQEWYGLIDKLQFVIIYYNDRPRNKLKIHMVKMEGKGDILHPYYDTSTNSPLRIIN